MSHVAPPAQGTWYNVNLVVPKVLARLQLKADDPLEPRVRELVDVAAGHINNELDRVTDMPSVELPALLDALERVTLELFRRGRTDRGQGGEFAPLDVSPVIDIVRDDISPYKSRMGLA